MFDEPDLPETVLFQEYFHVDTGMGLGASRQTGWTGLVADLICGRPDTAAATGEGSAPQGDPGPDDATDRQETFR